MINIAQQNETNGYINKTEILIVNHFKTPFVGALGVKLPTKMVYKVEKFGVRSGNTFKASGSKFLRRYRYVYMLFLINIICLSLYFIQKVLRWEVDKLCR